MTPTSAITTPITQHTERLAALVGAKRQVLEILIRLSRQQLDLIAAGEMASLIKLLAAKQTVIDQLAAIDGRLEPFRDEDPEQRTWVTPAARAACQADADQCNAWLAESMKLEQEADRALRARRDSAAAALVEVQCAADARHAYGPAALAAGSSLHFEG